MPEGEIAASACPPPPVVFGFDRRAPAHSGGEVRQRTPFRDATPHNPRSFAWHSFFSPTRTPSLSVRSTCLSLIILPYRYVLSHHGYCFRSGIRPNYTYGQLT